MEKKQVTTPLSLRRGDGGEAPVAVVTGGSGVLGSNVAEGLLKAGANVVIIGRHDDKVQAALERLNPVAEAHGAEVLGYVCDVLDRRDLDDVKERILLALGRVDILVNCAGGNVPGATIMDDQHVFDMKDGTLYWAAVNEDKTSALYSVDTTTGAAAKELDFADGEEFVAIYVPVSADPGAPAAPEDITVSFAEGAFTGTVAFTIPAVNAGGEPMTGDVGYAVIADDTDTLVTGTAAAGSRVEETVTLTGGKHKLTIVLSNEHGNGKSVNVQTEWVGLDVPYSPDNVELAIDDATGKAVLTWDAPTEGWNGGYIDPEQLSYCVTDFYTDEVLAEGLKDTRFEMNLEKGPYRPYRYTVTAFNGEVEAEWGNAGDAVRWGYPLEAPYANDVNTYELYDVLDIIDANNDRAYFKMSGQGAHNQPNWRGDTPSDDWLVLPPMQLKGNHTYNLSFDVSTSGDGVGTVEAGFGTDLEVAGYTMTMQPRNIDGRQTVECLIQISNDGVYRLGIHDLSAASQDFFGITISGIKVTEGPAIDAPAAVDDIVLTADAMGGMEVTGTFMTPNGGDRHLYDSHHQCGRTAARIAHQSGSIPRRLAPGGYPRPGGTAWTAAFLHRPGHGARQRELHHRGLQRVGQGPGEQRLCHGGRRRAGSTPQHCHHRLPGRQRPHDVGRSRHRTQRPLHRPRRTDLQYLQRTERPARGGTHRTPVWLHRPAHRRTAVCHRPVCDRTEQCGRERQGLGHRAGGRSL